MWVLLKPKRNKKSNPVQNIAVCSFYFVDAKSTPPSVLYDHIAETYNLLISRFGESLHLILSSDSNKLNLQPILDISKSLVQVVKEPTRLNPPAILDTIITSLSSYYKDPVTKPPISNDDDNYQGKPSDHLVVLWEPEAGDIKLEPRQYRTVSYRPLKDSNMARFKTWLDDQTWDDLYRLTDVNSKAEYFHTTLLKKFQEFFPLKSLKVSLDDQPWMSQDLKELDRKRKREFSKNHKSVLE